MYIRLFGKDIKYFHIGFMSDLERVPFCIARAVLHVQHITKSLKIGSYTSHTCTYIRTDTAGTFATKFHYEIRPFLIQSYTLHV